MPSHGIQAEVDLELLVAVITYFHVSVKSSVPNVISKAASTEETRRNFIFFQKKKKSYIFLALVWQELVFHRQEEMSYMLLSTSREFGVPNHIQGPSQASEILIPFICLFQYNCFSADVKPLLYYFFYNLKCLQGFRNSMFYIRLLFAFLISNSILIWWVFFFPSMDHFSESLFLGTILVLLLIIIKFDLRTSNRNA